MFFDKRPAGSSMKYAMSIQRTSLTLIWTSRSAKIPGSLQRSVCDFHLQLKGGVSKLYRWRFLWRMQCVLILIFWSLRILVIDLDPQSSATMFLSHKPHWVSCNICGLCCQNVSREEAVERFIVRFCCTWGWRYACVDWRCLYCIRLERAVQWASTGQNIHESWKKMWLISWRAIMTLSSLIVVLTLTPSWKMLWASANILFTPLPPATVDFHSSLKYVARLPELVKLISDEGCECQLATNIGFMSKFE